MGSVDSKSIKKIDFILKMLYILATKKDLLSSTHALKRKYDLIIKMRSRFGTKVPF